MLRYPRRQPIRLPVQLAIGDTVTQMFYRNRIRLCCGMGFKGKVHTLIRHVNNRPLAKKVKQKLVAY